MSRTRILPTPPRDRPALRSSSVLILASLSSSILAFIVGEAAFRLLSPKPYHQPLIHDVDGNPTRLSDLLSDIRLAREEDRVMARMCYDRPKWAYFEDEGCVPVQCNSIGLRDDEIPPKRVGEYRVLALGDSFTFGFGVLKGDTWCEQLELRLRAERGTSVRVINAGLADGAHEPKGYAEWLKETGIGLDPDLVILGFCLNDVHRLVRMAKLPPPLRNPWLGGHSHILNRVQLLLHRREFERRMERNPDAREERETLFYTSQGGVWDSRMAALRKMKRDLEAREIELLIAIFPMMTRFSDNYPYERLHAEVRSFCTEEGVDHIDLLPRFSDYVANHGWSDEQLWIHPTDQHPAAHCYEVFAEGIYEHLRN